VNSSRAAVEPNLETDEGTEKDKLRAGKMRVAVTGKIIGMRRGSLRNRADAKRE